MSTNYIPEKKDCSQSLRYQFTDAELKERGKKLAETHSKLAQLEADKKRIVSNFGAQVSAVKAEANLLADCVSTGYELRDIPCTATMDAPTIGKKTITRNDTGEQIEVQQMTPSENSSAQDARARAEYEAKNPVLDFVPEPVAETTDQAATDAANEAANPDPAGEEVLPGSDAAGEGEDEEAPLEPSKKKGKKAAAKPSDEF
jgi:hypothetical protein